jgi:hypothetical protein
MKKVMITIGFVFMFISSYSQKLELPGEYIRQRVLGNKVPDNVQGSPYYNESFLRGKVYTNNNEFFETELRYDAYNDEMQMLQNGNIIALLKFEKSKIEISNEVYEAHSYTDDDGSSDIRYFINLTKPENTTKLLLCKSKKFVEGSKAQNSYTTDKPPMFRDDPSYLILKDNTISPVKLSKKKFLNFLEDKEKQIDNYISQKELNFKNEEDFVDVINFYNSL